MPTKLSLYNGALAVLGETKLANLGEERAPRRVLDTVYDDDGIQTCLELSQWKFALRMVQLTYSPSVEPDDDFGLQYAFDKPDDFVRTAGVWSDGSMYCPLNEYVDEAEYWFANLDTIYVRYVSDDPAYGMNLSRWPRNFTRYVEHYFASRICKTITGVPPSDDLKRELNRLLVEAEATDAMAEPTRSLPQGSWASARHGGQGRWYSGNTGGSR